MISEAELIVDRRRLKRKLTLWRILAVLLALAAVGAADMRKGRVQLPYLGPPFFPRNPPKSKP